MDIPIINDMDLEDDHDFMVEITGAGTAPFATLGSPLAITITIEDDESECCFGEVLAMGIYYNMYTSSYIKFCCSHLLIYVFYNPLFCCADGLLTMDPIVTVEEGQDVVVCINLICTGSSLGCPLTVFLNVTGSLKAGSIYCKTANIKECVYI